MWLCTCWGHCQEITNQDLSRLHQCKKILRIYLACIRKSSELNLFQKDTFFFFFFLRNFFFLHLLFPPPKILLEVLLFIIPYSLSNIDSSLDHSWNFLGFFIGSKFPAFWPFELYSRSHELFRFINSLILDLSLSSPNF